MIGKTISHYNIIEKIGSGGMGIILKVQDFKLDKIVNDFCVKAKI